MNIVVYNSFLIICILMDQLVRMILSSLQLVAREGNYLWLNLRRFIVLRPSLYFVYFLSSPILLLKCHSNAHYYLTYQQVIISIPMINSMIITISITIDFMDVIWVLLIHFLVCIFFYVTESFKKARPISISDQHGVVTLRCVLQRPYADEIERAHWSESANRSLANWQANNGPSYSHWLIGSCSYNILFISFIFIFHLFLILNRFLFSFSHLSITQSFYIIILFSLIFSSSLSLLCSSNDPLICFISTHF